MLMAFFSKTKIVTLAPLRNENAFQSFFDELHRLAASTRKNLVLDLSSLSENPGLDFGFMIEDAWLSLTERGLGMAVVVNEGLVKTFRDYTFARSPIANGLNTTGRSLNQSVVRGARINSGSICQVSSYLCRTAGNMWPGMDCLFKPNGVIRQR